MIWLLFRKDIVQHARALLLLAVSAVALPLIFTLVTRSQKQTAGYAGFVFGYLGVSAPIMFAQWFIGQEKLKGTFRVLRLLPISGARVIVTKCVGAALLCLLLINMVLILEPAVCRSFGSGIAQPPAAFVLWINIIAVLTLAISMALFTVFDTRIATQAVIWILVAFMILGYGLQKFLGDEGFRVFAENTEDLAGQLGLLCLAILPAAMIGLVLVWFSARFFDRKEWSELEEN